MRAALMILLPALCFGQKWVPQTSGVTASLRGVAAVDGSVVWASGSEGTWLRTVDGGAHWTPGKVQAGETLDFRAIQAFSRNDAIVMSSGDGPLSKIFSTSDGGATWQLLFENPDAKGFFDGLAFSDRRHGALLGDPVNNRFAVFVTSDGAQHWQRREGPVTHSGEASFAAGNSTLRVRGRSEIWLASGGTGGARIFHSSDAGKTWTALQTPIRHDAGSAGIFSLSWLGKQGIAVGGDYRNDQEPANNIAVTPDGGKTWTAPIGPSGFRSAVLYMQDLKAWIATGTSGSDISMNGLTWRKFDDGAYNALSGHWAVGPKGAIAVLTR